MANSGMTSVVANQIHLFTVNPGHWSFQSNFFNLLDDFLLNKQRVGCEGACVFVQKAFLKVCGTFFGVQYVIPTLHTFCTKLATNCYLFTF